MEGQGRLRRIRIREVGAAGQVQGQLAGVEGTGIEGPAASAAAMQSSSGTAQGTHSSGACDGGSEGWGAFDDKACCCRRKA